MALAEFGAGEGGAFPYLGTADIKIVLAAAGTIHAKWFRMDSPWVDTENPQGTIDWHYTDNTIPAIQTAGMKPLVILNDGPGSSKWPSWVSSASGFLPDNPQLAANFGSALVNRYPGVYWEIGNELNLYATAAINARQYGTALIYCYNAMKAADPTCQVWLGAMLEVDTIGGSQLSPSDFLTGIYAAGAKGKFDAISYHNYHDPAASFVGAGNWPTGWARMGTVLAANGQRDMPIYITEYGVPTNPSYSGGSSYAAQATWLSNGVTASRSFTNCSAVMFFAMTDRLGYGSALTDSESNFGMMTWNYTIKQAYNTYGTVVALGTAPANSSAPIASGAVTTGATLISDRGLWTQIPAKWTHQWQYSASGTAGWANIDGATVNTYTVAGSVSNQYIRNNVSAINDAGTVATASNTLGPSVWPNPIQIGESAAPVADGAAYSMASNAAVGNTVFGVIYGNNVGTVTSSMGTVTMQTTPYGSASVGFIFGFFTIPVTTSNKTITYTGGGVYDAFAMELPGNVTVSSTPKATASSTNPTLTLSVASGQICMVGLQGQTSIAPSAFTGSPGTWTIINAGDFTWGAGGVLAYCLNGAATQTATYTRATGLWYEQGIVLNQVPSTQGLLTFF